MEIRPFLDGARRVTMTERLKGRPMQDRKREYLEAYEAWQIQLRALHKALLDGERPEPPRLKAILNREARSKERYDRARRALLGLPEEE